MLTGISLVLKTQAGEKIIAVLNAALKQDSIQQMMIEENLSYFPEISHPAIAQEWQQMVMALPNTQ